MTITLKSSAFENEERIPDIYTCTGRNISPPLHWDHVPNSTKSFVLIMEDLDTPISVLTHWIIYNIPSDVRKIAEDTPHETMLSDGMMQGRNGVRRIGYMGPCPPFGSHRYRFTIHAINQVIPPDPKMNKKKIQKELKHNILDSSSLIGIYSKKK